LYYTRKI